MTGRKYRAGWITVAALSCILLVAGCSTLPDKHVDVERPSIDVSDTQFFKSIKQLEQERGDRSGFYPLIDGVTALSARLAMIDKAEASLDVQYYIWHDDSVGRAMHSHLLRAADRGVKIRLLLDDLDTVGKDKLLSLIQYHPNIEIRLFNPFPNRNARWYDFLIHSSRLDHRMHNKSITADRSISIVGGRNIGDEYFNASDDVGFSDLDVIAIGAVAKDVDKAFMDFWESDLAYPIMQIIGNQHVAEQEYLEFRQQLDDEIEQEKTGAYSKALNQQWQNLFQDLNQDNISWGRWIFWSDTPKKVSAKGIDEENFIAPKLLEAMGEAKKELMIVSPYFVPEDDFTDFLIAKAKSGVHVKIMTNSLAANDVALVYAGYRNYRERLLRGGVELYEFKAIREGQKSDKSESSWQGASRASLHGKYLQIDQQYMFVGSFNLDPRSAELNTELGVLFESSSYASLLKQIFESDAMVKGYRVRLDQDGDTIWETYENNELVTYHNAPDTSFWQRFSSGILSWIVPESEL